MGLRAEHAERLVALFALGCLALTFPLLALFNRSATVAGIPLLYVYLFGVWAALIALAGWTVHAGQRDAPPRRGGG